MLKYFLEFSWPEPYSILFAVFCLTQVWPQTYDLAFLASVMLELQAYLCVVAFLSGFVKLYISEAERALIVFMALHMYEI